MRVIFVDRVTSQLMMSVDGDEIRGIASTLKNVMIESLLES